MPALTFQTVIEEEQVIRPPQGVCLPKGKLNVTVCPAAEVATDDDDPMKPTREWMLAIAREMEELDPDLPSDLAWNHDHYAHGAPKR